jgi:hypothetical protein
MKIFFIIFTLFFLYSIHANTQVIYITPNGAGNKDGTSWLNASDSSQLQSRLSNAPPLSQVWVAAGVYKPTIGTDRYLSFNIPSGVRLIGGFIGNETSFFQKNHIQNVTVLSGDIGNFNDSSDNSLNVVTILNPTALTLIDGFTITLGRANDPNGQKNSGGGIYNFGGEANTNINNCKFINNYAKIDGGAIENDGTMFNCSPQIINCEFYKNVSLTNGGAICNYSYNGFSASCLIGGCKFENNYAEFGGAVFNSNNSNPIITGCKFSNNAAGEGGVIYNFANTSTCSPVISSCSFYNNSAARGGVIYNNGSSVNSVCNPIITNCIFFQNSAIYFGGAIYNLNWNFLQGICEPQLLNCTFFNNSVTHQDPYFDGNTIASYDCIVKIYNCIIYNVYEDNNKNEIYYTQNNDANVTHSIIKNGYTGYANIANNPLFVNQDNPVGEDGVLGTVDDGLKISCISPAIDAGNDSLNIVSDFIGNSRTNCDIGAFEYTQSNGDWIGNTFDWNDPFNWYNNIIPTSTTNVCISSFATVQPILSTIGFGQGIVIGSGAACTITGTLNIYGSIVNEGNLEATSGTIAYTGTAPQTIAAIYFCRQYHSGVNH